MTGPWQGPFQVPSEEWLRAADGTVPAYVRRARAVEDEVERVFAALAELRRGALARLGAAVRRLSTAAGGEDAARACFTDPAAFDAVAAEARSDPEYGTRFVASGKPGAAGAARVSREVAERVRRFNRAWPATAAQVGLDALNQAIDRYNRYYRIEREAFAKYTRPEQWTFVPLEPRRTEHFLDRYPLLPALVVAGTRPFGGADAADTVRS